MALVARGGTNWVLAPLTLAILMVGFSGTLDLPMLVPLSMVSFFLFTSFVWFFRDPDRKVAHRTDGRDDILVSPADGKVVRIDQIDDPDLGPCDRFSIFMRVHDVHVNRAPIAGNVRKVTHHPGRHVPAFNKDSDRNERVEHLIAADDERLGSYKVIQIAGAVARRIVPYTEPGVHAATGDRIGLIRLGSRCDVIVPRGSVRWLGEVGDRTFAAARPIGELQGAPA